MRDTLRSAFGRAAAQIQIAVIVFVKFVKFVASKTATNSTNYHESFMSSPLDYCREWSWKKSSSRWKRTAASPQIAPMSSVRI